MVTMRWLAAHGLSLAARLDIWLWRLHNPAPDYSLCAKAMP